MPEHQFAWLLLQLGLLIACLIFATRVIATAALFAAHNLAMGG